MKEPIEPGEHPEQQASDLQPAAIVICAVSVVAMVLLVGLLAHLLMTPSTERARSAGEPTVARAQYLTSDPTDQITLYEQQKRARLESRGWVDCNRYAHIPIEEAMQRLAEATARNGGHP